MHNPKTGWWKPNPWGKWHKLENGVSVCYNLPTGTVKPPYYFGGSIYDVVPEGGEKCKFCEERRGKITTK